MSHLAWRRTLDAIDDEDIDGSGPQRPTAGGPARLEASTTNQMSQMRNSAVEVATSLAAQRFIQLGVGRSMWSMMK